MLDRVDQSQDLWSSAGLSVFSKPYENNINFFAIFYGQKNFYLWSVTTEAKSMQSDQGISFLYSTLNIIPYSKYYPCD